MTRNLINNRVAVKGDLDLDDPTVADRVPEEDREAVRQAARSKALATVTLRLLTDPRLIPAGEKDPDTGEVLAEPAVGLETGVIFQWTTLDPEWAPEGSEYRKELSAMMPYFQAVLGLQLLANSTMALERALTPEQAEELKSFLEGSNRLLAGQAILYQPIFEMVMNWYSDRSGARAEAMALLAGTN